MKATAVGQTGLGSLLLLCASLAGCSSSHVAKDGGSKDGSTSMDGSADDGGFIRRRDAQITSGDPIPPCMRFDPMPCGAGQQCQLVIRRSGDAGFLIYSGCVEGADARPLGAPCDQWGGQGRPYAADGLQDEVYVDPCAQGLYCAADPKVRGHYSCQRSCESGRRQGQTEIVSCPSPTQYCAPGSSMATGLEEVCRESDTCDPSDPTSCGPGRGCYLRLNDNGTGALSVCLPVSDMPVADGAACQYLNDCNPGSSCWGPARLPPSRWMDSDLVCHRSCDTTSSGSLASDAGDDGDGGPGHGGGGCRGRTSCTSFSGSGLSVSSVSVPVGQCE
jgi:hypothetical protein